jgi:hypothetical protein
MNKQEYLRNSLILLIGLLMCINYSCAYDVPLLLPPQNIQTVDELKAYLNKLANYYSHRTRPRFGKRSSVENDEKNYLSKYYKMARELVQMNDGHYFNRED